MAPGMDDLPYDEYEEAIQRKSAEPPGSFGAAPAGAYRHEAGGFMPEPRPGCTVLAEPYPITSLAPAMASLQDQLRQECPGFAPVPIETLHLTVADLISRGDYAGLAVSGRQAFCAKAARICTGHRFAPDSVGAIAGLGTFPSGIVALVRFTPAAYQALTAMRKAIHTGLSLPPPYPFTGHLTLGYAEIPADAPAVLREQAGNAVDAARQALRRTGPLTFSLDQPAVFTFPHMSRFDRW